MKGVGRGGECRGRVRVVEVEAVEAAVVVVRESRKWIREGTRRCGGEWPPPVARVGHLQHHTDLE